MRKFFPFNFVLKMILKHHSMKKSKIGIKIIQYMENIYDNPLIRINCSFSFMNSNSHMSTHSIFFWFLYDAFFVSFLQFDMIKNSTKIHVSKSPSFCISLIVSLNSNHKSYIKCPFINSHQSFHDSPYHRCR